MPGLRRLIVYRSARVESTYLARGTCWATSVENARSFAVCTLFVGEGVTVIASDSDQDEFTRNRVALLGEGRFALAVWQPSAFAVVDLAA